MFSKLKYLNLLATRLSVQSFCTSQSVQKQPTSLKGLKKSSQEWLTRQLKDPYVEKAKVEQYRCRSAFKLIEMDSKFHILKPGNVVVDCGASPGSWTQVAVKCCNADGNDSNSAVGYVIALDILNIYPIPGATILSGMNFTKPDSKSRLSEALNGKVVDVFLSDMAPNATGIKDLDHENIVEMAYHALRFSVQNCAVGGSFLVKIWSGARNKALQNDIGRFFSSVRIVKPPASRGDSAEMYYLGQGFKGLKA